LKERVKETGKIASAIAARALMQLQTLSRREEETLLKATKERALKECDDLVKCMSPLLPRQA
jgi:hypothetical protein